MAQANVPINKQNLNNAVIAGFPHG